MPLAYSEMLSIEGRQIIYNFVEEIIKINVCWFTRWKKLFNSYSIFMSYFALQHLTDNILKIKNILQNIYHDLRLRSSTWLLYKEHNLDNKYAYSSENLIHGYSS